MRSLIHKLLRLAAVGSLTIAGLAGGTTAAHADEPPVVHVIGKKCQGSQVIRCIEIHYDSANLRWRVWSSVWDADGGNNYFVKVINTDWEDANHVWQDVYDVHHGELREECGTGNNPYWVGVTATLAWLHPGGRYQDEVIYTDGRVCWEPQ